MPIYLFKTGYQRSVCAICESRYFYIARLSSSKCKISSALVTGIVRAHTPDSKSQVYARGFIVGGAGPVIGVKGNVRHAVGWPVAAVDADAVAGGAIALLCVVASCFIAILGGGGAVASWPVDIRLSVMMNFCPLVMLIGASTVIKPA
jgi:hypothetical protein